MLFVKVYHVVPLVVPLSSRFRLDSTQIIDALSYMFGAEFVCDFDADTFIHQKVDGKGNIAFLFAFTLKHGLIKA